MRRSPRRFPSAVKTALSGRLVRRHLTRARKAQLTNAFYILARLSTPSRHRNRVVFASELRPVMDGSLARLHDRMVERGLDEQLDFRYSFRARGMGRTRSTMRVVYLIATSDHVLIEGYDRILGSLHSSPRTTIIQFTHTGHGPHSLASAEIVTPGTSGTSGTSEGQAAHAEVLTADILLDAERRATAVTDFFAKYAHLDGRRVYLVAPAPRGRTKSAPCFDFARIDLAALHDVCGDDRAVLFRMPDTPGRVPVPEAFADRLCDVDDYPAMSDLFQVADVLVTDHSSVIYEYAVLNRPMLFCTSGHAYTTTHPYHRDFDLFAPGKVCRTFEELVSAIRDDDYDTWKIRAFRQENIDTIDAETTDRLIDQVTRPPEAARLR
jgi:CDP-ribitol ribitolphosphotransferase